jgi:formylglycine-generating enzyme required for sulfatase activity
MRIVLLTLLFLVGCTRTGDPTNPTQPSKAVSSAEASKKISNSIGIKLRLIPPGTFPMGSNLLSRREKPVHQVTITKPFYLGVYEVTQAQWQQIMRNNPSYFKDAENPVEQVSWDDAVEFCRRLSDLPAEAVAGRVYQLPTEAQWEYACRAGTTTAYSFGDDATALGEYAWFANNSGDRLIDPRNNAEQDSLSYGERLIANHSRTRAVGQKKPNAWGLHDMHGNVWEWCQDWDGDYPSGSVTDPDGPASGTKRILRGSCWANDGVKCWSAHRNKYEPSNNVGGNDNLGFRVAVSLSGK